ncbi:MAG: MoaD/ThiS family protein [Halanaerobiales bacterium]|nr:MoaD/ThiS family protein [Halanaerobiales bacterium]
MKIKVKFTEMIAKKYLNNNEKESNLTVEIEKNASINRLLDQIGIPASDRYSIMYTRNGKFMYNDKKLHDGDQIKIFPVLGGG